MKKYKVKIWNNAFYEELFEYVVLADSKDEAFDKALDGEYEDCEMIQQNLLEADNFHKVSIDEV